MSIQINRAARVWSRSALLCPLLVSGTLLITACATTEHSTPVRSVPMAARVVLQHPDRYVGDNRIGTYVSSAWGFSTNSFWIEGEKGLILIDTQFLPSAAAEFVDWAEQVTGKKAVLAIVLHANPDKFNGTKTLRDRGIRVITSDQVIARIPEIHEKRVRAFYERYQPDYPKELTMPESFGDKTTAIEAAGVKIKLHVLGPGCSAAHVVVEYDGHIFPGDLVANGAHSWLELGLTDAWLKRLDELENLQPQFVHPGRGPSGNVELLDAERDYLQTVIQVVAKFQPTLPEDDEKIDRIISRLEGLYSGYRFPIFLRIGIPAEWRRQAKEK